MTLAAAALAEERRTPTVRCEDGCIILRCDQQLDELDYRIPVDRCDTPAKLLGWILHLMEKRWITAGHMERLILQAAAHVNSRIEIDRAMLPTYPEYERAEDIPF